MNLKGSALVMSALGRDAQNAALARFVLVRVVHNVEIPIVTVLVSASPCHRSTYTPTTSPAFHPSSRC